MREAWLAAFAVERIENSWKRCGFVRDGVPGWVCNRSVYWHLMKEQKKTAEARTAAGITTGDLNYSVFDMGGPSGAAGPALFASLRLRFPFFSAMVNWPWCLVHLEDLLISHRRCFRGCCCSCCALAVQLLLL